MAIRNTQDNPYNPFNLSNWSPKIGGSTPTSGVLTPPNNSLNLGQAQNSGGLTTLSTPPKTKPITGGVSGVLTPNPNQGAIDSLTSQRTALQGQLGAATAAGYSPTQQIQKDAQGNVMAPPVTTNPNGTTTTTATPTVAPNATTGTSAPPTYGGAVAGLMSLGQGDSPDVLQARKELKDLQDERNVKSSAIQRTPGILGMAAGKQGVLNNQFLTAQNNAQTALSSAISTQGQRGGFTKDAAGLMLPYQLSPGVTAVSPVTNQPVAGGMSSYQDFSNLQFNTSQGQQLGKQASDIQTASNQADANFQLLSKLAGGINISQFPDLNSLTQALQARAGGDAGKVAAFNEAYNALQTSIGQIINSSGAFTPTEVSRLATQMSAAKLNPSQMQDLYNTVRATAATRINAILEQAKQYEGAGTKSVAANMKPASGSTINLQSNAAGNQPITWATLAG